MMTQLKAKAPWVRADIYEVRLSRGHPGWSTEFLTWPQIESLKANHQFLIVWDEGQSEFTFPGTGKVLRGTSSEAYFLSCLLEEIGRSCDRKDLLTKIQDLLNYQPGTSLNKLADRVRKRAFATGSGLETLHGNRYSYILEANAAYAWIPRPSVVP